MKKNTDFLYQPNNEDNEEKMVELLDNNNLLNNVNSQTQKKIFRRKDIGILIDSSCTIDKDFIKKHDIWIAPLSITDSNNQIYADTDKEITNEKMVELLNNHVSFKTAMTPVGQLMDIVENMLKEYKDVIFLPISKALSGQWQSSLLVKKEFPNLHIIESVSAGYPNEEILKLIVNLVEETDLSINTIIQKTYEIPEKCFTMFSVEEVDGMKSGGRVTNAIINVIDKLRLKPIIRFKDKNEYGGVARNYQKAIVKMIKSAYKWCSNIDLKIKSLCIYFSGYSKEKLEYIKHKLAHSFKFNIEKIVVRWIPRCVLAHTGFGSYGFSVVIN